MRLGFACKALLVPGFGGEGFLQSALCVWQRYCGCGANKCICEDAVLLLGRGCRGLRPGSEQDSLANTSPCAGGGADKLPAIKQASPRTHQSSDLAATSGGGGTSGAGISRQQTGGSKAIPTTPGAGHRETVSRSSTRTNLEPQPPQPAAPGSPRRPGSALAAAVGAAGQGFNAATTAYSPASAQHLRAGSRPSMDEGGPGAYKSSVSGPLRTDGPPSGRNSVAPPLSGRNSHAGNPSAHAAHRDSNSSLSSIVSQNAKLKNMVFVEAPATIEIESGAEPMVLPRRTPMTSMATGPSSPPAVSPSGQGPAPAPPPGAGAPGAAQQDPRNMDPKVYRRVQRIRSLPMLIDTNPLHHAALHQAAQQRQQQPRGRHGSMGGRGAEQSFMDAERMRVVGCSLGSPCACGF